METSTCKNCDTPLDGHYCKTCGQRSSIGKITFKETFGDFIDTVFSINAPLWRTLRLLILNPGQLFRQYLAGKRKTYYKPVPFFILTTLVYIILRSLIDYDPMAGVAPQNESIDLTIFYLAGQFMVANINNILFLFVFSCGLCLKIFFYKRFTFAEYLAISFYLISIYNLLGTLMMFYFKYINAQLKFLPPLIMLFFMVYALISFFKEKKLLVAIKAILVFFLSFFLYVLLGYGLSLFIVWIKNS